MLGKNRLFLIIIGFFCFFFGSTYAQENVIVLKKTKTLFIDYSENEVLKKVIARGDLKVDFSFSGAQLKKDIINHKLFLMTQKQSGTGSLFITIAGRTKEFFLKFSFPPKKESVDIRSKLPYMRLQTKPLTCESSASADSLSYLLGKNIDESEVFSLLPKSSYYNKLPDIKDGKTIWGNPNEGFVGYEDFFKLGSETLLPEQGKMTGYGVYELPLSNMIRDHFSLNTKIINTFTYTENFGEKEHLKEILEALMEGNMIVLWGDRCTDPRFEDGVKKNKWAIKENNLHLKYNAKNSCDDFSKSRKLSWYYEQDEKFLEHKGLAGQHAFYLLGFYGSLENPEKIRVWDTDTGYHEYPVNEWLRKWNMMNNRSLVIYKNNLY